MYIHDQANGKCGVGVGWGEGGGGEGRVVAKRKAHGIGKTGLRSNVQVICDRF